MWGHELFKLFLGFPLAKSCPFEQPTQINWVSFLCTFLIESSFICVSQVNLYSIESWNAYASHLWDETVIMILNHGLTPSFTAGDTRTVRSPYHPETVPYKLVRAQSSDRFITKKRPVCWLRSGPNDGDNCLGTQDDMWEIVLQIDQRKRSEVYYWMSYVPPASGIGLLKRAASAGIQHWIPLQNRHWAVWQKLVGDPASLFVSLAPLGLLSLLYSWFDSESVWPFTELWALYPLTRSFSFRQ